MAGPSKQIKYTGILLIAQFLLKSSSLLKQVLLAFFLGISAHVDLFIAAQIVPAIIASVIAGGAGEILVTRFKDKSSVSDDFIAIFVHSIVFLTIILSVIYWFSLPIFGNLFEIKNDQLVIFTEISFYVIISRIPAAYVSCLRHLLYANEKYKSYLYASFFSELLGILAILFFVNELGIKAFAIGFFITPLVNSIFFIRFHRLKFLSFLKINTWRKHFNEWTSIMSQTLNLGAQTFINYLSTFWERTLCMRYLQPGFLSALNYSKSLTELPRMAFLSSVLTTSYIEQIKRKEDSQQEFLRYSNKIETFLSEVSSIMQLALMIFAPFIVVILFKRGAFDDEAVLLTFTIFQILSVGFLPNLMTNFLSRTMYIESQYKTLFKITVLRFFIEMGIMSMVIFYTPYSIPIAIVTSKFTGSILMFFYLKKLRPGIFNVSRFIKIYTIAVLASILILYVNSIISMNVLNMNLAELMLIYIPLGIVFLSITIIWVLKRYKTEFAMISLNPFKRFVKSRS